MVKMGEHPSGKFWIPKQLGPTLAGQARICNLVNGYL